MASSAKVVPARQLGAHAPNVPGDKSISHRAVIFAAMATGESHVTNLAPGEDVASSLRCVAALGAHVERSDRSVWIRGGTWRSEMGETSEALFLTSGYAYDDAATVAARFAGEAEGMTYSRLQNPTVQMLEERIALLEGAQACRTQASGMAAMTTALLCQYLSVLAIDLLSRFF